MSENGVDDPGEAALGLPDALQDDFRTSFFRGYVRAAEDAVTQDQARCLSRCLPRKGLGLNFNPILKLGIEVCARDGGCGNSGLGALPFQRS